MFQLSTKQELKDKTLSQVYSELAKVFPDDADFYMYLMLERVGLNEGNLRTLRWLKTGILDVDENGF